MGPGDIVLHGGWVIRVVARERLDDVADPVRKLSQDLVASSRAAVASMSPPQFARSNDAATLSVILKLSMGKLQIAHKPLRISCGAASRVVFYRAPPKRPVDTACTDRSDP